MKRSLTWLALAVVSALLIVAVAANVIFWHGYYIQHGW